MSLTLTILTYVLFFASSLATWGGFLYSRRIRRENKALSLALVRSPEGELVGGHRVPPGFKHRIVLVSAVRRPIDEYDPASPEGEAL